MALFTDVFVDVTKQGTIVHNGVMKDMSVLQESPFTDKGSVVEVFTDLTVWIGIRKIIEQVNAKDSNEPEFLQAVKEVLTTIKPILDKHSEYEKAALQKRRGSFLYAVIHLVLRRAAGCCF